MAMPRFFTGRYRSRTFQSQVRFILGINSCCPTFATTYMHPCAYLLENVHNWGIIGQLFWLDGNRLRLGLANQCGWMLFQLVHELISFNGCGVT
jgi:hypothetical protein